MLTAVVLTFNSEASIERTLKSIKQVTSKIHVIHSFSSDSTVSICHSHGCEVVQRGFSNYSDQRNWAIKEVNKLTAWQLHVDADEELDQKLITAIKEVDLLGSRYDGYIVLRRIVFMQKVIKYGGISKTWHMRLFRSGHGKVEDRLYDQHFICDGKTSMLPGCMFDHQEMNLSTWTQGHNKWSDFEAKYIVDNKVGAESEINNKVVEGKLYGNVIERRRYSKNIYYKMPLFWRAVVYYIYRYVLVFGFLDGIEGLIYHFLQGFWFRFLVDAKIYESQMLRRKTRCKAEARSSDNID